MGWGAVLPEPSPGQAFTFATSEHVSCVETEDLRSHNCWISPANKMPKCILCPYHSLILHKFHMSVGFFTKPQPRPRWDKFACIWQELSGVWYTDKMSQLEIEVNITLDCLWGIMHVDATCGETEAGYSWAVPHLNSCFLFDLISVLPPPMPPSRPASRFLTAPGLCYAHFPFTPVHVSSALSRTTAAFTSSSHSHSSSRRKAPPWSNSRSYWTHLWVSTGVSCRVFSADIISEILGLVPCLVKSKGWKRSQTLNEDTICLPIPTVMPWLVLGCVSWGRDAICRPFRQVHHEGCHCWWW